MGISGLGTVSIIDCEGCGEVYLVQGAAAIDTGADETRDWSR
jgi:hypothetical protein